MALTSTSSLHWLGILPRVKHCTIRCCNSHFCKLSFDFIFLLLNINTFLVLIVLFLIFKNTKNTINLVCVNVKEIKSILLFCIYTEGFKYLNLCSGVFSFNFLEISPIDLCHNDIKSNHNSQNSYILCLIYIILKFDRVNQQVRRGKDQPFHK